MFARLNTNLPQEPRYPTTLEGLGYKLDSNGHFRSLSNGTFFPYHNTSNERVNDLHREAMHQCARQAVKQAAAEYGVVELFLGGEKGDETYAMKPEEKHLPILTTRAEELVKKRNVVVVVGEHTQDLGVWSWRSLMGEGGLDGGSVVGLAKELQKMSFGAAKPIYRSGSVANGTDPHTPGQADLAGALGVTESYLEDVPGVIVFNPGQLLYSHTQNTCMTHTTWYARPKQSVIGAHYKINNDENRVPGHATPEEHVTTMFDSVLPKLIHPQARLFVVGIGDGAEHVITYMDRKMQEDSDAEIGGLISALAFMQPSHSPDQISSPALRQHLASFAKSWITSSKPKNTWINSANGMDPLPVNVAEKESEADEEDDDNRMADSYDHINSVVSCHTYSGETDIDEMIWVNVRDEVLDFFKWIAGKEDRVPTPYDG